MSNIKQRASEELNKFLQSKRLPKGSEDVITHTLMGGALGSYKILGKDYEKFIDLYKNAVVSGYEDLYIVEKHRDKKVSPLVIDIDLDLPKECKTRVYKNKHIKDLIAKYNTLIQEHFDVDKADLITMVFEKDKPTPSDKQAGGYKDGFHIYYPYLPLDKKKAFWIYDKMLGILENTDHFSDLPVLNEISKILDDSIIERNGILMYGSHKKGRKPYFLSHVYTDKFHELYDPEDYNDENIIDLTSLRMCNDDGSIQFKDKYNHLNNVAEESFIRHTSGTSKKETKTKNEPPTDHFPKVKMTIHRDNNHEQKVIVAKHLVTLCLSKRRASNYDTWVQVGWALFNIDHEKLWDTWIEFSKKTTRGNFSHKGCEMIWNNAKNPATSKQLLSIGSIHKWAREDNEAKYNLYMFARLNKMLNRAKSGTHDDIANVIKELYGHMYKCTSIEKRIWYEFTGHRWKMVEQGYTLAERISSDLSHKFVKLSVGDPVAVAQHQELLDEDPELKAITSELLIEDTKGTIGQDLVVGNSKKIFEIATKLKDVKFRKNVMEACSHKFYDEKFEERLNSNIYLLGFENGVYDFKMGKDGRGCFRDGLPEDYITLSTGYDYMDYEPNHEDVEYIRDYFKTVQQNPDMREYVLRFLSSFLVGHTEDQKFVIWTGKGSNGKSTTTFLLNKSFGEYFGTLKTTIITRKKKDSGAPEPEIANKIGVRCIIMQEASENEAIYVDQMKFYTGGELIEARMPHQGKYFKFMPQFKLVMCCNVLPDVPATDDGTWRRLRVTSWDTKFVDNLTGKYKIEVKKDKKANEKLANCAPAFMWMLINEIYPRYIQFGLVEPKEVLAHTTKYQEDSDVYLEFISQNLTVDPNVEEKSALLYTCFKQWYKESYNHAPPPEKVFRRQIEDKGYEIDGRIIKGLTLRIDEDDNKAA
uniref:SF3 helicase domain-containing protein n=1 Tax=viral metagenome TaxID=1070528 RepID=A0A6C0ECP6_9ZZZZ